MDLLSDNSVKGHRTRVRMVLCIYCHNSSSTKLPNYPQPYLTFISTKPKLTTRRAWANQELQKCGFLVVPLLSFSFTGSFLHHFSKATTNFHNNNYRDTFLSAISRKKKAESGHQFRGSYVIVFCCKCSVHKEVDIFQRIRWYLQLIKY